MSRLDFISLNVRGYSTLLSLPLADLNVYKQKNLLLGGVIAQILSHCLRGLILSLF